MRRIILKHFQTLKPQKMKTKSSIKKKVEENKESDTVKNKKTNKLLKENVTNMTTQEKVEMAQAILDAAPVKRIKKDAGLIERVEKKTILTEDNKELLTD